MKALFWSWFVVGVSVSMAGTASAQTPVGALAVDERQGNQYGWAVDYETVAAAGKQRCANAARGVRWS